MLHLGDVPASTTLYVPFHTFNSSGASVTITGLAVTDIEIYKNGGVTQRASDNGYTLLDTDGIDFDGITGIHGFSVDLSDNSDAGFYSAGAFYWIVVSSITCDSQTVNFVAATFRIVVAENTSGTPVVDIGRISNDATAADNLETMLDGTGGQTLSLGQLNIVASSNNSAIVATGAGSGHGILATGGATGHGVSGVGGATSGDGLRVVATTSGTGITATGAGTTKAGIAATGGATTSAGISATGGGTSGDGILTATTSGHGIVAAGTGTTKHGISATGGSTTSHGISATGGGVGHGILATSGGGATGDGIRATAASTNGNGLNVAGVGTGAGTLTTGGATGIGLSVVGGGTSGNGINVTTTSGHGVNLAPVGTSMHGLIATGGNGGTSDGIKAAAGTGGVGLRTDSITSTGAVVLSSTLAVTGTTTLTGAVSATNASNDIRGVVLSNPCGLKKNTAVSAFTFYLVSSADHASPKTGATVTAERSLDGAAFGSCANAVSEIANGFYKIDLAAGDVNGDIVALKFTASGADQLSITVVTEP